MPTFSDEELATVKAEGRREVIDWFDAAAHPAQELTAVTYRDRSQTDETIRVLAEQGIRLVRVEPEP